MSDLNILKAKDAEIGKTYLLVLSSSAVYKLVIVAKHEGLVTVQDERYSNTGSISLETVLTEFDEEFYNNSKEKRKSSIPEEKSENNQSKNQKLTKSHEVGEKMARTKNPKSHIIDKLLAEIPVDQKPNFEEVSRKVLGQTNESEDHLKKVIAEVRVRYWMFTSGGKTNKFRTTV